VASVRSTVRDRVERLFNISGGMTDEELCRRYEQLYGPVTHSTVRTRRKELIVEGILEDSGETRETNFTGNQARVWIQKSTEAR